MTLNPVPAASPSVNPNFTPASLYVGDLKPDVSEALLFDVFNTIGPVASIRVCRDVISRRSLGYAYVNFHSVADAERALDTMNFSQIRGRACRIMWSQRDPSLRKSGVGNIFVKNLDKSIDHKTLFDTFSMFGNILSCKVATKDGNSLGYGFVHYETQDSAQKAIDKVNGMVIASREVHVAKFMPKSQRNGDNPASAFTNVYMKGLPVQTTPDSLKDMFSQFGKIDSVFLPLDGEEKLRGFGFVNFAQPEAAALAVQAMNGLNDMYVGRAQKKDEREKELRDKFDQLRIQQAEKYAGVNLYIKNLDDSVGDEQLRDEFKDFGDITSAKVMRDTNGRSKGFGFVCFTKREEATKAVTDMNSKLMCNKPLYVALAQRKEVRRQQLEAQAQVNRNKMATLPPPQMYAAGAPMFYQQPAGPGQMPRAAPGFMYPTQQMMGQQRWNPRPAQSPQLIAMPQQRTGVQPQIQNMYLMQQMQQQQQQGRGMNGMGGGGMMGGGMAGGRGGGRGRGIKPQGRGGPQMGQQAQQNRIKFTDNVRNPQGPSNVANPVANGVGVNNAVQAGGNPNSIPVNGTTTGPVPLTSQALARAPAQQQKQMIGERIFPLIQDRQPKLAGKITGMLLEMDNTELLHLLESQDALESKINEALAVLEQHENPGTGTPSADQNPMAAEYTREK